ncbi:hypothetical protein HY631_04415 [Candidatus Uhrbacteria bacterium]|nr:hypothetical protein [Candidatus Uhrbacteria bacterium]
MPPRLDDLLREASATRAGVAVEERGVPVRGQVESWCATSGILVVLLDHGSGNPAVRPGTELQLRVEVARPVVLVAVVHLVSRERVVVGQPRFLRWDERRAHRRVPAARDTDLVFRVAGRPRVRRLLDVGERGIGFAAEAADRDLARGTPVEAIQFHLRGDGWVVGHGSVGQVGRPDPALAGAWRCGVHLESLPEGDATRLHRHVARREAEIEGGEPPSGLGG